jgi:glyoxylase-like metal-dependent hydrolase (beta-lactamase superfamily II)
MLKMGCYELSSLQTGTLRLDGGAMFGVVPRVMWASHEDIDGDNRILLATRTLLVVSEDRRTVMLVDTGTGRKWESGEADRFAISGDDEAIELALSERYSLTVADVTDVIVTHLHFDHNGGLTDWTDNGRSSTQLRFPKANHWVHRRQWEHAHEATPKDRASFLVRDFVALEGSDRLRLVEGDEPDAPWDGVEFFVSDGHTPGQLLPIFSDGNRELIFAGDVIPTSSHLRLAWVMAYDLEPVKTIEEKSRLLERCRERGSYLAFPHDHRLGGGEIDFAVNKPFVSKPLDL